MAKRKSDASTSSSKKSKKSGKPHVMDGITASSFLKHSPKITMQLSWEGISDEDLEENRYVLSPKKFGTGSFGWGTSRKFNGPSFTVGETAFDLIPVSMSANLAISNSKDLPRGTPSPKGSDESSEESSDEEEKNSKKKSKGKLDTARATDPIPNNSSSNSTPQNRQQFLFSHSSISSSILSSHVEGLQQCSTAMSRVPHISAALALLLLPLLAAGDQVAVNSAAYLAGELGAAPTQSFLSSNLTPPLFNIEVKPSAEASTNYTFLSYRGSAVETPAPVIMDNNGSLVWSGAALGYGDSMDLKVQMFQGQPVLTFFSGSYYSGGYGYGHWNILSSNYSLLTTVESLNQTSDTSDFHEFLITSNDTALVESWRTTQADLSAVSGYAEGDVWTFDCVFQEIDIASNNLLFEWRALEHLDPSASYFEISSGAGANESDPFDWCHINSLEKDNLGNYLVSMRGPSTIYYISGADSSIIWQLGGKNSSFAMGSDATFWYQHDARFQSDNAVSPFNISIFDNAAGGSGDSEPTARGIVLSIDTSAMTAELVYAVAPSFNTTSPSQGSHQILQGGTHLIGWGAVPQFSEYTSTGELIQDVRFGVNASTVQSYRAYKQAWTGSPSTSPAIALNTSFVAVSWNGATEVKSWVLQGGSSASNLSSVSTTPRSGFETEIPYQSLSFLSVAGLSSDGTCLGVSEVWDVASLVSAGSPGSCPPGSAGAASSNGTSDSTKNSGVAPRSAVNWLSAAGAAGFGALVML